ncbi:MAG: hypothetical protein Q7J67_05090 [bacterium]|nr:hypothetical protein [bacterium]
MEILGISFEFYFIVVTSIIIILLLFLIVSLEIRMNTIMKELKKMSQNATEFVKFGLTHFSKRDRK